MAKIPPLSRLRIDDFKDLTDEVKPVVEQLAYAVNPFIQATTAALSRRLTWANFAALQRTVQVRAGESFPLFVSLKDLPGSVGAVFVTQCYDATDRVPALAPRIAWQRKTTKTDTGVEITAMSDLTVGHEYQVSLLVTAV